MASGADVRRKERHRFWKQFVIILLLIITLVTIVFELTLATSGSKTKSATEPFPIGRHFVMSATQLSFRLSRGG